MSRSQIGVMVVEDHEVVRAGIAAIIDREPDLRVAGTAASGEEALRLLDDASPDVVILDHRMPGMSGAATCREITRRRPSISVVVLTSYLEDAVIHSCLAAGARAYLLKGATREEILHAVRAVARGGSVLSPQVIDRVVEWARRAKATQEEDALNSYELIALSLVALGLSNRDIGRKLNLSETTVKVHLRSAMKKLRVTQRAEAVAAGIRKGMI